MNWILIGVIVVLIIIFTFVFKTLNNPISYIHCFYYDATITNDDTIVKELNNAWFQSSSYYYIYIVKIQNHQQRRYNGLFKMYYYDVGDANNTCFIVMLSNRFRLSSVNVNNHNMVFSIYDGVVRIPIISNFWHYHTYTITLAKFDMFARDKTNIFVGIHTNGVSASSVIECGYTNVRGRLMKTYTLDIDKK
jgi:hypothetical protein